MSNSPVGIETSAARTSLYASAKDRMDRFLRSDCAGLHFSANMFVATTSRCGREGWAPITAAIIIASELERHSKIGGIELRARHVAEVLLGCVVGVAVSWAMSKPWPSPTPNRNPSPPNRSCKFLRNA
jgi:hypothetical protein